MRKTFEKVITSANEHQVGMLLFSALFMVLALSSLWAYYLQINETPRFGSSGTFENTLVEPFRQMGFYSAPFPIPAEEVTHTEDAPEMPM